MATVPRKSYPSIRTIFDQVEGRDYRFDGGNLISGCQLVAPILLVNTRKINRRRSIQRNRGWVLHTEISLEKKKEQNEMGPRQVSTNEFTAKTNERKKKEKEICSKKREKKTHYFYISLFLTLIHRQD